MTGGNRFKRVLLGFWHGADALRKVLHLVVLLVLFGIVVSVLTAGAPRIPERGALLIQPQGSLVEQLTGDPFDRGIAELMGDAEAQTLVRDIVDGLRYAAGDRRITAVVLDLRAMGGAGLSKLQRIGEAIDAFRESGKPVIAHGAFFSQGAYYLAARADEVYMDPQGILLMEGFGAYRNYYKDAIDKLKIDWNVFRAGEFKTGFESYTRNDMSDEDRSSISRIIERLWSAFQEGITVARELPPDSIERLIAEFRDYVTREEFSAADVAVEFGLVDELVGRDELVERIARHAGRDEDSPLGYNAAGLDDYVATMRLLDGVPDADSNVAIIVAAGEILIGRQPPGTIGGESTAELLAGARRDEAVSAVVLRVDSPGGSVFASEQIYREVLALQEAGKPVVASMSSIAASGGYWISMAADRILANETTITGSIGVLGMFPTFQRTLDALGVHTDGVGTTSLAGALRLDRELSPQTREIIQALIEDDYDRFIDRVSSYRGLEREAVRRIAEGQVWTGREALNVGLVDEIGDFERAVAVAAELAGLEEGRYGRRYYEPELSPAEKLALQFLGGAEALGLDIRREPRALERLAGRVEAGLAGFARFNDPRGSHALCLACGALR